MRLIATLLGLRPRKKRPPVEQCWRLTASVRDHDLNVTARTFVQCTFDDLPNAIRLFELRLKLDGWRSPAGFFDVTYSLASATPSNRPSGEVLEQLKQCR